MHELTDLGREMQQELASGDRSAVRFPVHLPVRVMADGLECTAETENFSSSGALFRMSTLLPTGSTVHFLIEIPAGVIGSDVTAAIQGEGKVIRSYEENGHNYSAIVIHDYRFQ
jgi:hypothetical protein